MISLFLVILVAVVVSAGETSLPNFDNNEGATVTHNFFERRVPSKQSISTDSSLTTAAPRIVGGTDAGGYIDYQVLLLGYGECGGNLIAPNVVLR